MNVRELPNSEHPIFSRVAFRADDGSLVDWSRALRIQLKDFGNQYACPGIDDISGEVIIPFYKLFSMVQRAEKKAEVLRKKWELDEVGCLDRVKRKRSRSPPEEIYCQDGERFQEQAEEVQWRLSEQDSDYSPSSEQFV